MLPWLLKASSHGETTLWCSSTSLRGSLPSLKGQRGSCPKISSLRTEPTSDAAENRVICDADVVPHRIYPRRNLSAQGPNSELESSMLTALEMLSAYTAGRSGDSTDASRA